MVTPGDATEVVPYLTSAATIVALQKYLKTLDLYQRFVQAFPGADKYGHWFVAGICSLTAAAGIHVAWNWTAIAGGTAVFTIPPVMAMIHGLADFWKVFILQHTVYEATTTGAPLIVEKP